MVLSEAPHNLPTRLTSFVGRAGEIGEVAALLEAQRLVTLVGAPGVGKTRLGLQIAGS
jgi:MoxR-like ATPase